MIFKMKAQFFLGVIFLSSLAYAGDTAWEALRSNALYAPSKDSLPLEWQGKPLIPTGHTKKIKLQVDQERFVELPVPLFAYAEDPATKIQPRDIERLAAIVTTLKAVAALPPTERLQKANVELQAKTLAELEAHITELKSRVDIYLLPAPPAVPAGGK